MTLMKTSLLAILFVAGCSSGPVVIPDGGSDFSGIRAPEQVDRPSPDNPTDPDEVNKPDTPDATNKSNASGNNGKGGNYDKTGHSNNGKGKQ